VRPKAARLVALVLVLAFPACRGGAEVSPSAVEAASLPPLTIRDDTADLLLTWLDARGNAHTELSIAAVPPEGRSLVRVVIAGRHEGTGNVFYVVDLTQRDASGGFSARSMPRAAWEEELDRRRDPGRGGSSKEGGNEGGEAGQASAIVYGASWCKPCHMAEDWLKARGVSVVKKDIEQSAAANREMREKLEKAGLRSGEIPVIDLRGRLFVGFEPRKLEPALKSLGQGVTL
jgi:glutaredoxin